VKIVQTYGTSRADLRQLVRSAVEKASLLTQRGRTDVMILCLTPEFMILNKHYFAHKETGVFDTLDFELTVGQETHRFSMKDLIGDHEAEVFLLKHRFSRVSKGLIKYLPLCPVTQSCDIEHVQPNNVVVAGVANPDNFKSCGASYPGLQWAESQRQGMCCNPVIGIVGGSAMLVGIVSYGRETKVGCTLLSKTWFERCVADVSTPLVEDVVFELPKAEIEGLSLSSDLRNVPSKYLASLGTAAGPNRTFKTSLRPTRVFDIFGRLLSSPFVPPFKIRGIAPDGEYKSAFTNTCKNIDMDCDITTVEIESVVQAMLKQMAPDVHLSAHKIKLSPLSLTEALFGSIELGIDRIDFKTSVGAYLRDMGIMSKHDMFYEMADEIYVLKSEVMQRIKDMDADFRRGIVPTPFSDMVPKDELRLLEKIEHFKIRLFCVMDTAFNLYARMYLMPLIQYVLKFPHLSECYGGMNAGSHQWHELAIRLKRDLRKFFDMDFSSFDWSHFAQLFEAAALFFRGLALLVGYDRQAADVVYLIFLCFKWQMARYKNDIFLKFKGMPSGVIFTLLMNSFVNSFLLRVAFRRLIGDPLLFTRYVDTANVGDDNVNSVDPLIASAFNMLTISAEYRCMGYVATPAQKGTTPVAFLEFEDLSFVKRKFVWSAEMGEYVAPLEEDSIWKAFCYESSDMNVSSVERLKDTASGAQRECFLHGREFFAKGVDVIDKAFAREGIVYQKLNYEQLLHEYRNGAFRTFALSSNRADPTE